MWTITRTIQWFKVHLVIRGDHQVEEFDYNETFAPVAKWSLLAVFFLWPSLKDGRWSVRSEQCIPIWGLGQRSLYDFASQLYVQHSHQSMSPPEILIWTSPSTSPMVRQIVFQIVWVWLYSSYAGYSLFTYRKGDIFMALLLYVNDIVLAGNDSHACHQFKDYLYASFSIQVLRPLRYFLRLEVAHGLKGLFPS